MNDFESVLQNNRFPQALPRVARAAAEPRHSSSRPCPLPFLALSAPLCGRFICRCRTERIRSHPVRGL